MCVPIHKIEPLKTIVYVDGYNLYYGRLSGTPYKWLDVGGLFKELVRVQDPESEVIAVKFFTAPALARYARHGQASVTAQSHYHRAIEVHNQGLLSIIEGKHQLTPEELPTYVDGSNPDKAIKTKVWKIVEKKTDVNIAVAMYSDAVKGLCHHSVLCSNDSDAEPALEAIREDFPYHRIGLVTPSSPTVASVSKGLQKLSDWTRKHITDQELERAQLPARVTGPNGKLYRKPDHW